jgi:hypothetical protein
MIIKLNEEQTNEYYRNILIEHIQNMIKDDLYLLDQEIEELENGLISNYKNLKNSLEKAYNELKQNEKEN